MTIALPEHLVHRVEALSNFQRTYCEFRAKGLTQAEAALRAGSDAKDAAARGSVGYSIERIDGAKEYIAFLTEQRAVASGLDSLEIINKLRDIYDLAITKGKYKEANTSVELMAKVIGLLGGTGRASVGSSKENTALTKNDTEAFKEEELQPNETEDRIRELQLMIKQVNTGNDK